MSDVGNNNSPSSSLLSGSGFLIRRLFFFSVFSSSLSDSTRLLLLQEAEMVFNFTFSPEDENKSILQHPQSELMAPHTSWTLSLRLLEPPPLQLPASLWVLRSEDAALLGEAVTTTSLLPVIFLEEKKRTKQFGRFTVSYFGEDS